MQSELVKEQESSPVSDRAAEFAEVRDNFYRRLENGPIEDLVMFFGLGPRVIEALGKLGCETGPDLSRLNPNKWHHVSGQVTGQRIFLLWRYLQLRQRVKDNDAVGPSPEAEKVAVSDAAQ